jgi:hypothetical protein
VRNDGDALLASEKSGRESEVRALHSVGRFLQLLGLVIPLVAIAGNIAREDQITLKVSLIMSGIGIAIFILGWLLQQVAKPR